MRLWKVDEKQWTIREVEGEPWPGNDSDGDACFENTHFVSKDDALEELRLEVEAWVSNAARMLNDANMKVEQAQAECGKAAIAFQKVLSESRRRP